MLSGSVFQEGALLKPQNVYFAAVGLLRSLPDYAYVDTIHGDDHGGMTERAQVFRKKIAGAEDQFEYHVIYYPGKDNEAQLTTDNTTLPLKQIRHHVDEEIAKRIGAVPLVKHFFICESNSFRIPLPLSARHFVYGKVTEHSAIIEDSMGVARQILYDISGAASAMTDNQIVVPTYHGWQGLRDHWQCGYYMLEALHRNLDANHALPADTTVKPALITEYEGYNKKGSEPIAEEQSNSEEEPNPAEQPKSAEEPINMDFPKIEDESSSDKEIVEAPVVADPVMANQDNHAPAPEARPLFSRPWVRNLSVIFIFAGATVLSLGIIALTGGFGSVLTPLIFGLAIAGCAAGGLVVATGGSGLIAYLKKIFGKGKQAEPEQPIKGTYANVGQTLGIDPDAPAQNAGKSTSNEQNVTEASEDAKPEVKVEHQPDATTTFKKK